MDHPSAGSPSEGPPPPPAGSEQDGAGTGPPPSQQDGPPPPPWQRRRRDRLRVLLTVGLIVVVLAVGVVLALAGAGVLDRDDQGAQEPAPDPEVTVPDEAPDPEPEGEAPDVLEIPDVDALAGVDAVFGHLLVDIDASERTMIAFQDELAAAFAEHGLNEPTELIEQVTAAAAEGAASLADIRVRLAEPVDHPGAELVRQEYVDHLDAWMRYMEAVESDPALLDPEVDDSRYILAINASAGAFSRALEGQLPGDIAPDVEAFAEGILDRGFRMEAEAEV